MTIPEIKIGLWEMLTMAITEHYRNHYRKPEAFEMHPRLLELLINDPRIGPMVPCSICECAEVERRAGPGGMIFKGVPIRPVRESIEPIMIAANGERSPL